MEPLDRYLRAVKFWLPRAQKEDIAAELSEEIRSQVEEKEAELGRKLDEDEIDALLNRWGNPLLVAERYLPSEYLIGPVLFPLYRLALKVVFLIYLVPWLMVWASLVVFDPPWWPNPGLGALTSWWLLALHLFVVITVVFAVLERKAHPSFLERGGSLKPSPADPNRISRSQSVGESVGGIVVILWWLDVMRLPTIPGVRLTLAPIWGTLFWPILLFYLAEVTLAGVNLFRPVWTKRRAAARLAIDAAGLVLVSVLVAAGWWIDVTVPKATPDKLAAVQTFEGWLNQPVLWTLVFVGVVLVFRGIQDARRVRGIRPIRHWAFTVLAGE